MFSTMKRRVGVLAVTAAVALGASAGTGATAAPQQAHAAKSCSSGYVHAVMPDGSHKCLRVGQFCKRARAWQRVYHRHGFHCKANRHLGYR